ncbi:MAG: hypothetical protein U5L03_02000 [Burkholderiaceae bacterium]|nr:hypothetical protein [Burkholderiaceae bacterium]
MQWTTIGHIAPPTGTLQWARSHLTMPTPLHLGGSNVRIFFSARDDSNVGRIGYVDIDMNAPGRITAMSLAPALDIGTPGSFDDNGVAPSSVVALPDGRLRLYYVGFELSTRVRYRMLTGVADSEDSGRTFRRVFATPVLERSDHERLFRCGPQVLPARGGGYDLWYAAGSDWALVNGKSLPVYDLRHVHSVDGLHWAPEGRTVLEPRAPAEHGLGRPWVFDHAGQRWMLLSVRDTAAATYRLGCAAQGDDGAWSRCDDIASISPFGPLTTTIDVMYASVLVVSGTTVMFYNGRDFGADGIGIARLS